MHFGIRPPTTADGFVTVGIFLFKLVLTIILSLMFAACTAIINFMMLVKTMPVLLTQFGPVMNQVAEHSLWVVPVIFFIMFFIFFWKKLSKEQKKAEADQRKLSQKKNNQ